MTDEPEPGSLEYILLGVRAMSNAWVNHQDKWFVALRNEVETGLEKMIRDAPVSPLVERVKENNRKCH